MKPLIVTSALPYANGSIHLGHLVEYVQADIFVRFNRLLGRSVVFACADDTHGTPIEIAASKQGIAPEELIRKYYEEHSADFSAFHVDFDVYHSTNSPENKYYSDLFFNKLNEQGFIQKRLIELTYCESCRRFLPDRYVKGTCPKCSAAGQYGDQCEKCNATYQPVDLIDPACSICGKAPVRKQSLHYFFKLGEFSQTLRSWLSSRSFQPDVLHFIQGWLDSGLQDWDISRDGPYFGFRIPGEMNKFYYVWLDAPIGYISAVEKFASSSGKSAVDLWEASDIVHFIGKDIIYFHFLFWPAMLEGAGFALPSDIIVHGHLTINGEKMSKSRGNFLTARDFLATSGHDPEFLRFYYASHLVRSIADINLDFEEFKGKVNNDLVGNIANFVHRSLVFLSNNFDSRLAALEKEEVTFLAGTRPLQDSIIANYKSLNFKEAVRGLLELSSMGNRYFQENQPWQLVKADRRKCQRVVSCAVQLARDIAILAYPILPRYSERILRFLGYNDFAALSLSMLGSDLPEREISPPRIIFAPIEGTMSIAPVFPAALRVGRIEEAIEHPDAEKLYVLKVDLGQSKIQLVAGLRMHYKADELLGRLIIVVSNLKPARLRGYESQGMLLAADDGSNVVLVSPKSTSPGDLVYPEGYDENRIGKNQITIDEFFRLGLRVKDEKVIYSGKPLRSVSEVISVEAADDALVR